MQLRMKVVQGKPRGHCLVFPVGKFMFGRGPECDVRPNSDLVSRQHCILEVSGDTAIIRDLGSRNGTLINGKLLTSECELTHGDTLQLGPLVLEVMLDPVGVGAGGVAVSDTTLLNQDDTQHQSAEEMPETAEVPDAESLVKAAHI